MPPERLSRHASTRTRGQATVLGVVLLVGIVAMGTVGLLVFGGQALQQTTEQTQDEQVKQAFRKLDKEIDTVATTESGHRRVTLDVQQGDAAVRKETTGRIVVTTTNRSTPFVNRTIGALEYTRDGTTFAYQAGAVWRGSGADAVMISPPELSYQDSTLTLPVTTLVGDRSLQSGSVLITKSETPKFRTVRLVRGEVVVLKIQSEYYGGWARYFRQRTADIAVEVYDENETVVVRLGRPQVDGGFENGVHATGNVDGGSGNAEVNGPVAATGSVDAGVTGGSDVQENVDNTLTAIDTVIDRKVAWAEANRDEVTLVSRAGNVSTLQGGTTYYAPNGFEPSTDVTVDLSTGNVSLIVNGDVVLEDAGITVTNGAGIEALRTYASGDLAMKNSQWCVDEGAGACGGTASAKYNQVYGTSEMQVGITGGSTYFEGTIYAPREEEYVGANDAYDRVASNNHCKRTATDDYDVCLSTGSSAVDGAIVAGSMKLAQSTELNYDSGLQNVDPVLTTTETVLPPEITYLHVAVYEVKIEDSN